MDYYREETINYLLEENKKLYKKINLLKISKKELFIYIKKLENYIFYLENKNYLLSINK